MSYDAAPMSADVAPMSYESAPIHYAEPTPATTEPVMIESGSSDCGCGGSSEVYNTQPVPVETYSEVFDGGSVVGETIGGSSEGIIESAPMEGSTPVDPPAETAIPDAPVEG